MPIELILILGLVLVFVVPIVFDINVGVVAFVAAFLIGTLILGKTSSEVLSGFPVNIFVMLVGITLLLGIAHNNGTVDWLVNNLVRLADGRLALLPWVLFGVGFLASSMGPGAAPVLFVIGVGFIKRHGLNPVLVAAMIIHGSQSGGYSPVAPYGLLIAQLAEANAMEYAPIVFYLGVAAFHVVLAMAVFLLLGGRKLLGQRVSQDADAPSPHMSVTREQLLTLAGFLALVAGIVFYQINPGLLALSISLVLLLVSDRELRDAAVNQVSWPIVLVIGGVLTYINLLIGAGATDWLAAQAAGLGSPLFVGLVLCFLVAVVTGIASTAGTIGVLIPLSAPFVVGGQLDGTMLLTAMAISAAVTDISPFSTWGALFLATAAQTLDKDKVFTAQLKYTLCMLAAVPPIAWLIFVVPGW
jgi:di/tricarboxylate transporter